MPVWHDATRSLRETGRLRLLGITQEQHADRCLLFARWKRLDWPILWDPFNLTGSKAVPRAILLDPEGVVRSLGVDVARIGPDFLDAAPAPAPPAHRPPPSREAHALAELEGLAPGTPKARYYEALSSLLWPPTRDDTAAVDALAAHAKGRSTDAAAWWRLGTALRMRHDGPDRRPGDLAAALDAWRRGLSLAPDHYIYRRRLQQYGPRLDKPYPFYSWVEEARAALRARGEDPPEPTAPLTGAEVAGQGRPAAAGPEEAPVTAGVAEGSLLGVEPALVWHTSPRRGDAVRLHLVLTLRRGGGLAPDPDAGPVVLWLTLPEGWSTEHRRIEVPPPEPGGSADVDFEVGFPGDRAAEGVVRGVALYHVCRADTGECSVLRQAFEVQVPRRP